MITKAKAKDLLEALKRETDAAAKRLRKAGWVEVITSCTIISGARIDVGLWRHPLGGCRLPLLAADEMRREEENSTRLAADAE